MNIMVVGLGSMGRRRIRLLVQYDSSLKIIGVDPQPDRRNQAEIELHVTTYKSIEEACNANDIELAFVATSPLTHNEIIRECLSRDMHVFTEINLVDNGYDENSELAERKQRILFLSSTFLYRKEVNYIRERVLNGHYEYTYVYHTGQYLPDWHPWESYKGFFAGKKETNGCRETLAIEFPWLTDVFGEIKTVNTVRSKNSDLDIDYPDTYLITIEHNSGHKGMMAVDIVSRKPARKFEVFGQDLYITWNGTPDSLFDYNVLTKEDKKVVLYNEAVQRSDYRASIIEDAYEAEIKNFFKVIEGKEKPKYTFKQDKEILSVIDFIEGDNKND